MISWWKTFKAYLHFFPGILKKQYLLILTNTLNFHVYNNNNNNVEINTTCYVRLLCCRFRSRPSHHSGECLSVISRPFTNQQLLLLLPCPCKQSLIFVFANLQFPSYEGSGVETDTSDGTRGEPLCSNQTGNVAQCTWGVWVAPDLSPSPSHSSWARPHSGRVLLHPVDLWRFCRLVRDFGCVRVQVLRCLTFKRAFVSLREPSTVNWNSLCLTAELMISHFCKWLASAHQLLHFCHFRDKDRCISKLRSLSFITERGGSSRSAPSAPPHAPQAPQAQAVLTFAPPASGDVEGEDENEEQMATERTEVLHFNNTSYFLMTTKWWSSKGKLWATWRACVCCRWWQKDESSWLVDTRPSKESLHFWTVSCLKCLSVTCHVTCTAFKLLFVKPAHISRCLYSFAHLSTLIYFHVHVKTREGGGLLCYSLVTL